MLGAMNVSIYRLSYKLMKVFKMIHSSLIVGGLSKVRAIPLLHL